jgi:hypothetical protein
MFFISNQQCIICVLNFITFFKNIDVWNSLRGSPLRSDSPINIILGVNCGVHGSFHMFVRISNKLGVLNLLTILIQTFWFFIQI